MFRLFVDFQCQVFLSWYLSMSPNMSCSSYIAIGYIVSYIVTYSCYVIQIFVKIDKLAVRHSMLKVTHNSQPTMHVEYNQMLPCTAIVLDVE